MKNFPNKMIAAAYESAKGKVFHKKTKSGVYTDQYGSSKYNHTALQWLEDHGILEAKYSPLLMPTEYRIVK